MTNCPNLERPLSAERRATIGASATPDEAYVPTFRLALTRRVRVTRYHEVVRTKIVFATSVHPRIAGAVSTHITNNNTSEEDTTS